jgi:predicted nucleic acid-binding protein
VDRLFLDANVLFSAAYRSAAGVARLWTTPAVELLSSTYAAEEARRNLESVEQQARLDELLREVRLVSEIMLPEPLASSLDLPDKDEPILAGALAANATHLITGDRRHFGRYFGQSLQGIVVMSPARYLQQSVDPSDAL